MAKAATSPRKAFSTGWRLEDRIVLRYRDNPNGSTRDIAGILNEERNVMGMMPHPERAADALVGGTDGLVILGSLLAAEALKVPIPA